MAWFGSGWGLATIVAIPLVGTAIVALTQPKSEDLIKGVAFVTILSTFMLSVLAARGYSPAPGEETVVDTYLGGMPGLADRYYVTDFGIRLPILVLFGLVAVLVVIYSWNQWRRPSHSKALVMVTLGVLDILMFELMFEEGTPAAAAALLVLGRLSRRRDFIGGSPFQPQISSDPHGSRPLHRPAAGRSNTFEEEMSGLV